MQTQPTSHPEVLQVTGRDTCAATDLEAIVHHLEEAARRGDRVAIDVLLGQVIPGFEPTRGFFGATNKEMGSSAVH
jgi:hypothetical protein